MRLIIGLAILTGSHLARAEVMPPMDHSHHHQHASIELKRSTASYAIPTVSLLNQHGKTVSLAGLLATDKPVLLNFIYTSCTAICPALSATFTSVQSKLGQDTGRVVMLSVSIDPENDRPRELNNYAQRFKAQPQWSFLTGSQAQSIAVQQAFNTYRGDKMNHAPVTLFRPGAKAAWVRYDGFAKADDLVREVRAALSN